MNKTKKQDTQMALRKTPFTVFDQIKPFSSSSPPNPDSLISSLDSLISSLEYSRSTLQDSTANQNLLHLQNLNKNLRNKNIYDARVAADEAYRSACASLASGRYEEAVSHLRVAIDKCPPEKIGAVKKLKSLMDIAQSQLNNQNN